MTIHDVLGRNIKTLVQEYKSAGNHSINFDASEISSGVYYYTLKVGSFVKHQENDCNEIGILYFLPLYLRLIISIKMFEKNEL